MATEQQRAPGYRQLWDTAHIDPKRGPEIRATVDKIMARKPDYVAVEKDTGVPWFVVAALHMRESGLNFRTHLHNGDPLDARTRHVPAGRPAVGSPPFTFAESAKDALTMSPHFLDRVKRWSVERDLFEEERFNGEGYFYHGVVSPYLAGGTDKQEHGKYVADGVWSSTFWDPQLGTIPIMVEIASRDPDVAKRVADREDKPPADVIDRQIEFETKKARATAKAGTAGAASTGVAKATIETPDPTKAPVSHVTMAYVAPLAIAIGIAVVIVAAMLIVRKRLTIPSQIAAKWGA